MDRRTGSFAQTVPCGPSHHRYTQCVYVALSAFWFPNTRHCHFSIVTVVLAPSGDRTMPASLYCLIRVQVKLMVMVQ